MKSITLGESESGPVSLDVNTLQRHYACFGSSGCGKTVLSKVFIEELANAGVPIIAIDPQGDIASLAELAAEDEIAKKNVDSKILRSFSKNVEVVVWTPGSSKGLPICMNPLQFSGVENLSDEDKTRYFSATAKNIVSLIGYELDSDDGKSAEALLSVLFEYCFDSDIILDDFKDVTRLLNNIPGPVEEVAGSVATSRSIKRLHKKLSLLTLGSRKLIFQTGVPANVEALLGLDGSTDKTRVSIIYLNTLHTTEEKEFFITGIAQLLYRWMLKNPLSDGQLGVQCALFIDEIAPYIPPVKVPACKEGLNLLFRQGRKYGVSCLVATQSPGDIDYKAVAQFSTMAIGTLNTDQEKKKVKGRLESVAPKEIDFIMRKMPAIKRGEFFIISPDEFDKVQQLKVRWLVTKHRPVPEGQLKGLIPESVISFYKDKMISTQEKKTATAEPKDATITSDPSVQPATDGEILVVHNKITERDLKKKIRAYLEGTIIKSEKLKNAEFTYLPLVKVRLTFIDEKGFFNKTQSTIPENLYLDFQSNNIVYIKRNRFYLESVVDRDPHKIQDLDDSCTMAAVAKEEVDYDFRGLGGKKLDKNSITKLMERKYRINVHDVELVLFPTWNCTIIHKESSKERYIAIDGIFGKQMQQDQK